MARDVRVFLTKNMNKTFDEFMSSGDIKTKFGRPVIGFVSTTHPMFDTFFVRGENDHPKKIYRPGYSAVVSYVPYYMGDTPEEIQTGFFESVKLVMELNKTVKQSLSALGRLCSNTCELIDWNKKQHRREWSDLLAAYLAGMGEFGPAGSFVPNRDLFPEDAPYLEPGWTGRAGTILTDGLYADKAPEMTNEELEAEFDKIWTACCFEGAKDVCCSEEMIQACPGGAISASGIDRALCQQYCETINSRTPNPDVCAQCYKFK